MTLAELNALPAESAEKELLRCCGSTRWAREMTAARPFVDFDAAVRSADRIWSSLETDDWREAFAAHPRIGERTTSEWSAEEQSGAGSAGSDIQERLAQGNREYERRFGQTFLIYATGKSANEMLRALEERLRNGPEEELRAAAEEQRKITGLRLKKLISS